LLQINAEKSPYLTDKLKIWMLPTSCCLMSQAQLQMTQATTILTIICTFIHHFIAADQRREVAVPHRQAQDLDAASFHKHSRI
jgi:hypothetical protein